MCTCIHNGVPFTRDGGDFKMRFCAVNESRGVEEGQRGRKEKRKDGA